MGHPSWEEGLVLCATSIAERKSQPAGDTLDILASPRVLLFAVQMLQHERRIRPESRQLLQISLVINQSRPRNDLLDIHLYPRVPLEILRVTGFNPRTELAKKLPEDRAVVIKTNRD